MFAKSRQVRTPESDTPIVFSLDIAFRTSNRKVKSFMTFRCQYQVGRVDSRNLRSKGCILKHDIDSQRNYLERQIAIVADRKSTRLNSSHSQISYAVFCLKKKKK